VVTADDPKFAGTALHPLPVQATGVPWPTTTWPVGVLPENVNLDALVDSAFDPEGPLHQTYSVVIVHRGRLVFERYDGAIPRWDLPPKPVTRETPLLSWSMAKSMLHAVVGMLVAEGRLVLDEPAPVAEWQAPGDPRGAITLEDLLEMRDGLDFDEEYEEPEKSDVLEMLFGRGKSDMAAFAADRPLAAPPGSRFSYSSGASNVISGIVAREVGPGEPYRRFLAEGLFGPLGMTSASATLDEAGTWAAASYVYATARDFAKFGLLYLRDGMWEHGRLLPEGWVDHGRRPRSVDPDSGDLYGSHWWTRVDFPDTFWASGHEGQFIDVCPPLDLVLVRMGRTGSDHAEDVRRWRAEVIDAFVHR
jgi:CubicO group peptidase (beta-lactamase class C family)